MASISEEQISEFKEGFGLFDRKGNGTIEAGSNVINFEKFLEVLMRPDGFKPAGTYQEFINGFKVFDKEGNGYISVGELRYVLTNLGEKLSDAEVDELLKGVEVDKGSKVNYEDFVKMILSFKKEQEPVG
ncbi:unnamed protein product [Mortierella alpina]